MTNDGIFIIRIEEVRMYWMARCTCEMDVFFILLAWWNWWCIVIFTPQDSVVMDVNSATSSSIYRSWHQIESSCFEPRNLITRLITFSLGLSSAIVLLAPQLPLRPVRFGHCVVH